MVRIDTEQTNEELEKKIKRMESKLSHSRNKVFGCFNFALYVVIILLILGGYVSFLLAKSGVKDVPILTQKYYEEPEPMNYVDISNYAPDNLLDEVLRQTKDDFNDGEKTSFARITLDDKFLTYELKQMADKHLKSVERIQAEISPNSIDLYSKAGNYVYTAKINPIFKDGKIRLKVSELYLGEIKLPTFIGNLLLKSTIEGLINQFNELFKVFGQIKDIQITDGVIEVIILVNKNAKILNVF